MEFKEYTAKTEEEAITEATMDLMITSDELEYEVVEKGGGGIFGIGRKNVVIKARKREAQREVKKEVFKEPRRENKKEFHKEIQKETPKEESVKTVCSEATIAAVKNFTDSVLKEMGIDAAAEIDVVEEEKVINVNIEGDDTGDLIGKRGQTLDSLQYLISIVANKNKEGYYRVKLDTKNYRERRQKTLENLAKNVASKVKKTRHKVVLEPMNPYERRIIHSYLQGDKFVTTKSEGEEPNRRVVVFYKK